MRIVALLAFAAGIEAALYAGIIDMPNYAYQVPLNITVDDGAGTAVFEWVWDQDAAGRKCGRNVEIGLEWRISGNKVTAKGKGVDPSFYSFTGTLNGRLIQDGIVTDPSNRQVGSWSAELNAPRIPSSCGRAVDAQLLWPLPRAFTSGASSVSVQPGGANFFTVNGNSPLLSEAFKRYLELTFPHRTHAPGALTGLAISVSDFDESFPQLGMDETYQLSIPADAGQAKLTAKTVWGALRGLESFSQLVVFNFDTQSYYVPQAPWSIDDAPRFPHRGLMIDTARHFQPLKTIRATIDALPYAKLNVLHIHVSDSQSFPLEIKTFPKLWQGRFSDQERYTQADMEEIVEFARLRGVRVMVEFDMPGHAAAWCKGYPEVCPSPTCTEPLNVANNFTFTIIESLLNEMTGGRASTPGNPSKGLFKDNMIHLGGDEVDTRCWSQSPQISAWLRDHNMDVEQAYAYFVKRASDMVIAQGHRPVQWSEVFDHFRDRLAKETIVHIWKPVTNVTEVVALNYNVLINVGYVPHSWYLDNLQYMWDSIYTNEPCLGVPNNLCPKILGGHGEMWGETVDASNLEQTVWPRMAAIAERLWSPRNTVDIPAAHTRILNFRCLLNRRGVTSAPVNNKIARSAPPGPGSCYAQ